MKKQRKRAQHQAASSGGASGRKNLRGKRLEVTAFAQHGPLRGWKAIGDFLALPVPTAQRWAKSGMPVRREGRFTVAEADELRQWLGRESEMPAPAHIATNSADLATGLRESIAAIRRQKRAT